MRPRLGGRFAKALFKPTSTHTFLNVRTYVMHRGELGIYFMTEWVPNKLAAFLGPRTFGLPYRLGDLDYHHHHDKHNYQGLANEFAAAVQQVRQQGLRQTVVIVCMLVPEQRQEVKQITLMLSVVSISPICWIMLTVQ